MFLVDLHNALSLSNQMYLYSTVQTQGNALQREEKRRREKEKNHARHKCTEEALQTYSVLFWFAMILGAT